MEHRTQVIGAAPRRSFRSFASVSTVVLSILRDPRSVLLAGVYSRDGAETCIT